MQRRLVLAVTISAGVHLAVLVTLLAWSARPVRPSVLRVRVLPSGGATAELRSAPASSPAPASVAPPAVAPPAVRSELPPRPVPAPARASPAPATPAPPSVAASTRLPARGPARTDTPPDSPSSSGRPPPAATGPDHPIPVQSDIWVLTPTADGSAAPGAEVAPTTTEGTAPPGGKDAGARGKSGGGGGNPGGSPAGPRSLLAELGRRLAQSAARCTPSEAARVGWSRDRGLGVPVHFCLDASGRPTDVGLQGSTGSDLLDRAARECVVPGAVPLPPAPGCYTVEVLFPVRG
jgi:outer membrane biosynthesis protein TonB